MRPERIPNVVPNENIDLYLIQKFLSYDALSVVANVVKTKAKESNLYMQGLLL